jgi:hypothetical protein
MSTERKPGSRGVREASLPGQSKNSPKIGAPPENRDNPNPKGSTKTASPKKGFKKKRK